MKNAFGGSLLNNKRKIKRPLEFSLSTHMTLRLKPLLPPLFEPHDHQLRRHFWGIAKKYNIRIYNLVLNHTHMHSVLLLPNRESYVRFIREVTALLTLYFAKSLKFFGVKLKKIFTHRPFTRSVPWGRAFKLLQTYMQKNEMESGAKQMNWNDKIRDNLNQLIRPNQLQLEMELRVTSGAGDEVGTRAGSVAKDRIESWYTKLTVEAGNRIGYECLLVIK